VVLTARPDSGIFESLRTAAEQLRARSEEAAAARARVDLLLAGEDKARAAATGPLAVFVIDRSGRIERTAGATLIRLGMAPDDLTGRSIFDAFSDRPEFSGSVRRALEGQENAVRVVIGEHILEARTAPVRDRDGRAGGALSVWVDVTERERAALRLHEAEQQMREALEARGPVSTGEAVTDAAIEVAAQARVRATREVFDGQLRALAERLRAMEAEAQTARAAAADLAQRDELLRAATERERVQAAEISRLLGEIEAARGEAAAMRMQRERVEAERAAAAERARAAADEAAAARAEAEAAAHQVDTARTLAQVATREAASARLEAVEAENRMRGAADEVASARGEIARFKEEAEAARQQAVLAVERAAVAQRDLEEGAVRERAAEREERERLESELRSLTERLNVALDEAASANLRAQDLQAQAETAARDTDAASTLVQSATREANEMRKRSSDMSAELAATRSDREAAETQLVAARRQVDELSAALRKQVDEAAAAIEAATTDAAAARAQAAEAERRLEALTAARLTFVGDGHGEVALSAPAAPPAGETVASEPSGYDALTALPDRRTLVKRLGEEIQRARGGGRPLALLLLDLDDFKDINDTFGHPVGDTIIRQAADRIRSTVRESDIVARLGGDEFAVVLVGMTTDDAIDAARQLLQLIDRPFSGPERDFDLQASLGIAPLPDEEIGADELLRRADVAMYGAKRTHGGFVVYSSDSDDRSPERLLLLGDLRRAIARDELRLFWQPQVRFTTGQIVGMEALVRWEHPRRGLLNPDVFVPLAERTGVIKPLHEWVLREALQQCKAWSAIWDAPVVAVNTSMPNVLDPRYIDTVRRLLHDADVAPQSLTVEVTESVIMGDPEHARSVVSDLRTMGVRVSIDDFGTGYSSLGYLQQLDVNEIKVDKSFVIGVAEDRAQAAIVRTSIDLGHHFGLEVVAEGVEDQRSWDVLFTTGCDTAQGFHISPPLPPAEVVRSLTDRGWIRHDSDRGFRRPN
jgi:diguanylate cyclase (GGDEF)-like protein/PAS domain S-box-containing protein